MERAGIFLSRLLCLLIAAATGVLGFYYTVLPEELTIPVQGGGNICGVRLVKSQDGWNYSLGSMTIKSVSVTQSERKLLIPGGNPFGIKLKTKGVMVISVNRNSPADKAGIKPGDVISAVNNIPVGTNSEIAAAVQKSEGQCTVTLSRGSSELCINTAPADNGGELKLGAWVKDSAAGIGTMTFYDENSGCFAGLGHPVSDNFTGELMPLSSGEITDAEIYSIIKSSSGNAGELCGELAQQSQGTLTANTPVGVFGNADIFPDREPIPMAFRSEVKTGGAYILTTLDGNVPQKYSIEIEKINLCSPNSSKSMVISITDKRLLEQAGGIVRGMSGSPIIQNGMLVGAVTHVFVNNPSKGYAVFAESMTEQLETENARNCTDKALAAG